MEKNHSYLSFCDCSWRCCNCRWCSRWCSSKLHSSWSDDHGLTSGRTWPLIYPLVLARTVRRVAMTRRVEHERLVSSPDTSRLFTHERTQNLYQEQDSRGYLHLQKGASDMDIQPDWTAGSLCAHAWLRLPQLVQGSNAARLDLVAKISRMQMRK